MVCEHIACQNTSSQRHDLCCSTKQVNGFHIGIFLRSEQLHRSGVDPGLLGGEGGHNERQRRELCRGVWGYIFQKLFKN